MKKRNVLLGLWLLACGAMASAQETSLEDLYRSGAEAFREGRSFEALDRLGALAAQNPAYRDVQMLLGQSCLVAGLTTPAKRHFETALRQDPNNGHAAFLLGFSLLRGARYFEAAEALAAAQRMAPGNPHPLTYRGVALLRLGRAKEARQQIAAALRLAQDDPVALAALAELDLAEGRLPRAESRLRTVLRQTPGDIDVRILLGRALLEGGSFDEAAVIFQKAIEVQPPRSDLLYLLAQSCLRGGQKERGQEVLSRFKALKAVEAEIRVREVAVNTQSGDHEARLALADLMTEHGFAASALVHVVTLEKELPGDPRVQRLRRRLESQRRR